MSEADEDREVPRRPGMRWWRVLPGVFLLLALMLAIAWSQRVQIAGGFLDRELAKRGVPARYKVTRIGFFTQRIEAVSIGDPAHPDLTADWLEVQTAFTLHGPVVTGVRAGPLLLHAKLANGRLALGSLDKLMPAPSGGPVTLPRLFVDLADARVDLLAPQGRIALGLKGRGRLDDGFSGRLTTGAPQLDLGGCAVRAMAADAAIRITRGRPSLRGPLRAEAVRCGDTYVQLPAVNLAAALDPDFAHWRGTALLALTQIRHPQMTATGLRGSLSFNGSAAETRGRLAFGLEGIASRQAGGRGVRIAGDYRAGNAGAGFDGTVTADHAALAPATRALIAGYGKAGAGTPVGPLVSRLAGATAAAARDGRLEARLSLDSNRGARIGSASFAAAAGARAAIKDGEGIAITWPDGGVRINATVTLGGGGMPDAAIRLAQATPGGPITGTAFVQRYEAGSASLALAPVRFTATPQGTTRVATRATLSGPLATGRIEGLDVPIEGRLSGGDFILNPGCAPLAFQRLQLSSLALGAARLRLCPAGPAWFALSGGRVSGGVATANVRLAGRVGDSPLSLAASTARFDLARRSFALAGLATRIGAADSVTRLDIAAVDGSIAGDGASGTFSGAGGQIGAVPLLLGEGQGRWRMDGDRLSLDGGLKVSDTAGAPRFLPLTGSDVRLTLENGRIAATGTLTTPKNGSTVANVTLVHDLSAGQGSAELAVPGIDFSEKGLQPSDLTPLTLGVIAAVQGRISGDGHIRWNRDGVTSDGVFRTAKIDLAAAVGPVTGVATEMHFTDLLGMRTAPGQVATVGTLNPGVPVANGTIRYRLLDSQRVQVEGGRWPFAGGELTLDPTLLDFSTQQPHRMTFRLVGVDAARFLQEMDFKNLDATGIFDGELPIIFDASGGRIEGGRLVARPGGGTLAYVGEVSQHDLGAWGNMAFQALKSLNYRNLTLAMNGSLAGDMVTEIRFAGVSQGIGAKSNFLVRRLQRLPFVFNITIRAPFRQLLDSVQSWYDPSRLIQRNLPALLDEQEKRSQTIQPPESETLP